MKKLKEKVTKIETFYEMKFQIYDNKFECISNKFST